MRIEELNKSDLDNLDISNISNLIQSEEHKQFFLEVAGKEHYRLLSYISLQNNFKKFIDIGTFKGCSALALSINSESSVNTFNILDELNLSHRPNNINFHIDDVLKPEYLDMILDSDCILVDTFHDGGFERELLRHLENNNYKGVLILDDIHYYEPMTTVWNEIKKEKYDITEIGHWSGTGLVYFN